MAGNSPATGWQCAPPTLRDGTGSPALSIKSLASSAACSRWRVCCRCSPGSPAPDGPGTVAIIPAKRRPGAAATARPRAMDSAPGAMPHRPIPASISTNTPNSPPDSPAAADSCSTLAGLSTATVMRWSTARAQRRRSLGRVTTWLASRMSLNPAAANTSASPTVATAMPAAPPAANCRRAICGQRWLVTTGRILAGPSVNGC